MTTPIIDDCASWFDGLRPDAKWQLPDPGKPTQATTIKPAAGFGETPSPQGEPIEAFMQRVLGIQAVPAPVFGEDDDNE